MLIPFRFDHHQTLLREASRIPLVSQWVLHEVYGALICSECIVTMMIRALKNNSDGLGAAGRADPAAHGSKLMVLIQGSVIHCFFERLFLCLFLIDASQPFNAMIPVVLHKSQADILFLTDKRVLGCQVCDRLLGSDVFRVMIW